MANWLSKKWIVDVKKAMLKHSLTQTDVALLAGIASGTISNILAEKYEAKLETFVAICHALDLDPRKYFI